MSSWGETAMEDATLTGCSPVFPASTAAGRFAKVSLPGAKVLMADRPTKNIEDETPDKVDTWMS
jgi:lipid-binding SYLF domain-containing protein